MSKSRIPMQVSPEFEIKLKKLQENIMRSEGKMVSLRDLTEKITRSMDFDKLENDILTNPKNDIKIKLDIRRKG